ncbi:MAG: chemotaxis protein CheB [Planctomycetota bacterium]
MNTDINTSRSEPISQGHVVGIGASAGGLEALEQLFQTMPTDTGLSFVIVQHLSPDFDSVMDELLIRKTDMSVQMVEDGMEVMPDSIYLIPPKKEMIISGGKLLLTDKDPQEGLSLPIDQFFRSLARECGEKAVGVILSGTGSDGSRGIRDIHGAGGLVIVQSDQTAKFDGMPKSAMETGIVDLILPPSEIGEVLGRYVTNPIRSELVAETNAVDINEPGLKKLIRLLREQHGIDFSVYKQTTVLRRIERRLLLSHSIDFEAYVESVATNRDELHALYKDLLIGVTQFFRDPEAFDSLAVEVLPERLASLGDDEEFRVWIAGCATGEEAYSMAILLDELCSPDIRSRVKIFATDVHQASLDFASAGIYDEQSLANLSTDRRDKYFVRKGSRFQVLNELRKMIVFAQQNVIRDAPFTKLDLVSCRNMLIYFQPAIQRKVISLFHFGLKTGGVLLLGPSEGVGELEDEFKTVDRHWKIFKKRRNVRLNTEFKFLASGNTSALRRSVLPPASAIDSRDEMAKVYDELLDEHLPPSVLINEYRRVIHVFGDAGRYLEIKKGRTTGDILELFDAEFRTAISGAIQRVAKQNQTTTYTGNTPQSNGNGKQVKISVSPIFGRTTELTHMLISFSEINELVTSEKRNDESVLDINEYSQTRISSLEDELRHSKENLQATIEELETSNEELQATNEELIASNEEMQSTNEELHSVNEELYTVNAEYQRKIIELTEITDDMEHLFASTDVGVLFLDKELSIRKFTPRIARLFNFIEQDIGQSFDRFTHNIQHKELLESVRWVMETNQPYESDVVDKSGHEYFLRILPYHAQDSVEGIVLTLIDVAPLKKAEKEIRRKDSQLRGVMQNSPAFIFIKDLQGRYLLANEQSRRVFGVSSDKIIGKSNFEFLPHVIADRIAESDQAVLTMGNKVEIEEVIPCKGRGRSYLTVKFPLKDETGSIYAIAGMKTDITKMKVAQGKAKRAIRERDKFLAMLSHELRNPLAAIQNASGALSRMSGSDHRLGKVSDVIRRQGKHLSRILDDLLDISRVVQNKIELRKQSFDLRTAAEDALLAVRSMATTGKIKINKTIPKDPVPVFGDESRLEQVIANLLVNAVKYTPENGEIDFRIEAENGVVEIAVRDNGSGMEPKLLKRIFEPFVQGDTTIDFSQGGMGVGLTLVKTIVTLHDGEVFAESEGVGKGSLFRFTLPLSSEQLGTSENRSVALTPDVETDAVKLRVVVVEDEADIRDMMTLVLEMDGHQVIAVEDGLSAVTAIEVEKPDLAFIDIGLPELDGYEVMARLKEKGCEEHTLCIALTGFGQQKDISRSKAAGFHRHITKPVSNEDLQLSISDAISFKEQTGSETTI